MPTAESLRDLRFENLSQAVAETESLLETGYERRGKWTLGQACRHLRVVQDCSIDGYPWYFGLFAFMRPFVRPFLLPRIMAGNSPIGVPTTSIFVPGEDADDATEASLYKESVARLENHTAPFHPHPGFGRLNHADMLRVYTTHAAHHLRFLEPRT
ncbi:DUF1569 domain-containing protein [Bremerella cremea]|uniref:DUF1569 domain-containing protein n=1 Tax=Bremerella cremea TaxID=1031537 RepID=UPI0031E53AC0